MQSVRTTDSNVSSRVCIGEFCPNLSSVAAILHFGGHCFHGLLVSSGIKFSDLSTSFLTICQNRAIDKNYSFKFEIRDAPTSKRCYLLCFMVFRRPYWISGNAQGWELRKKLRKNNITHFHLMAKSCCPLPDYYVFRKVIVFGKFECLNLKLPPAKTLVHLMR